MGGGGRWIVRLCLGEAADRGYRHWREVRRPESRKWADTSEVYLTFIPSSIFYTSPERVCGVCHVLALDPDRDLSTAVRDYKQKEGEEVSRIASAFRGAHRGCREVRSITFETWVLQEKLGEDGHFVC